MARIWRIWFSLRPLTSKELWARSLAMTNGHFAVEKQMEYAEASCLKELILAVDLEMAAIVREVMTWTSAATTRGPMCFASRSSRDLLARLVRVRN